MLAVCVATLPTTNVGRGIRLPRKEFRGHRASPNKDSFGKCLMQEAALDTESYPIKMTQKNVIIKDGKIPNDNNYQDYCIFLISLYRAKPFAVSKYFCLG